jgi:ribosome-binding protein aMBF1 (putative translation factor)
MKERKTRGLKPGKKKRLEAAGWKVGSPAEFLRLSDEEITLVELKLSLSETLRKRRISEHLSQSDLAKRLHSSQSRVAKMEASDPAVSIDLLIRGLLATGAGTKDIARAIAKSGSLTPQG